MLLAPALRQHSIMNQLKHFASTLPRLCVCMCECPHASIDKDAADSNKLHLFVVQKTYSKNPCIQNRFTAAVNRCGSSGVGAWYVHSHVDCVKHDSTLSQTLRYINSQV